MMIRPVDWSVVIAGRWNRAILTPAGIAKRLFGIDNASQIRVAVPLDGVSPYQVRHPEHGIVAMTDDNRIIILATRNTYENLKHAMAAGVNALRELPVTPVTAAGFNVNYFSEGITTEIAGLFEAVIDKTVSELGKPVRARSITRSLEYGRGVLNFTLSLDQAGFKLQCNFNLDSKNDEELKTWLQSPLGEAEVIVGQIVAKLGLEIGETEHDEDGQ